jgi:hypothetical protein
VVLKPFAATGYHGSSEPMKNSANICDPVFSEGKQAIYTRRALWLSYSVLFVVLTGLTVIVEDSVVLLRISFAIFIICSSIHLLLRKYCYKISYSLEEKTVLLHLLMKHRPVKCTFDNFKYNKISNKFYKITCEGVNYYINTRGNSAFEETFS